MLVRKKRVNFRITVGDKREITHTYVIHNTKNTLETDLPHVTQSASPHFTDHVSFVNTLERSILEFNTVASLLRIGRRVFDNRILQFGVSKLNVGLGLVFPRFCSIAQFIYYSVTHSLTLFLRVAHCKS